MKGKHNLTINIFKEKKYVVFFAILLLLQLINVFYWGSRKEGFFGDELYSYQFVCQTQYPSINSDRPNLEYLNNWHADEYYKDYLTVLGDEAFDIIGVYNSIKEDVHPPLYYIFLHIMCALFGYFTKWSAIVLNIVFFVLANIILYLISKKLIKSKITQLIPNLIYGFSVGAVSTVVFARMYMQLACITLLFVYLNVVLLDKINEDSKIKNRLWFGIFATTILGVLTQYYFLIFAFFLCALVWIYFVINKKILIAIKYTITMFLGLIGSYLIWPAMYNHIFNGYRGDEAFRNLKEISAFSYFDDFISIINNDIFAGKIKVVILAIFLLMILKIFMCFFDITYLESNSGEVNFNVSKKKLESINIKITEKHFVWLFIFITFIFDVLILAKITPYKIDRYVFNVYPIVVLLVVVLMNNLCEMITRNKLMKVGVFVLLTGLTFCGYIFNDVEYLYEGVNENLAVSDSYSDLPVVLLTNKNARFTSCSDSIYFQNGQNVYPIDETGINDIDGVLEAVGAVSFLLYIDNTYSDIDMKLRSVEENTKSNNSQFLYSTNRCDVYLIDRKEEK